MRKADLIIGSPPQTLRWHLFRWRGYQLALHKWLLSDSDRALHDHSAWNVSILLTGCYREWLSHLWEAPRWKLRLPLVPYFRPAAQPHRIELFRGPVWTLWFRGPPRRQWGFWCRKGWRHWKEYVAEGDYSAPGATSTRGRGCDE